MRLFLPALVAVCGVFTCQSLTVRYSYGGNWSGLFLTGALLPPPVALSVEHIYLNPSSVGYDGQAYQYIAHDPFFQRGTARLSTNRASGHSGSYFRCSLGCWPLAKTLASMPR